MHKQVRVLLSLSVRIIWAHAGEEPGKPTPGGCLAQVVSRSAPMPILMPTSVSLRPAVPGCRGGQE